MSTTRHIHEVHCILIRMISLPLILALDVTIVAYLVEQVL